jgi:formate dehydrogenase maturation protein FdhE
MRFECTNCFSLFDTEDDDDYEFLEDDDSALLNTSCPNCGSYNSLIAPDLRDFDELI